LGTTVPNRVPLPAATMIDQTEPPTSVSTAVRVS